MSKTSLSVKLKKNTWPLHTTLDHLPTLQCLVTKEIQPHQYEGAIIRFYACFNLWAPVFEQAERQFNIPEFAYINCHLDSLSREISNFNLQIAPDALPKDTPMLNSIEHYLGYSYVLTGSQVGGQLILKKLTQANHLPSYSFDYFRALSGFGEPLARWNQWKEELDSFNEHSSIQPQQIINSANESFNQLISWFTPLTQAQSEKSQ